MKSPLLFKLACVALVVASVVVVLGAFTRLADAGLGCPDWPTCYGHLWVPNESHEIDAANQRFQDTPVETDKTWPEQIHRIFASSLGLLIIAMLVVAIRNRSPEQEWKSVAGLIGLLVVAVIVRIVGGDGLDPFLWILVVAYFANLIRIQRRSPQPSQPFVLPALLAGLVILQGFFGMWTVTLKLWPQVVTAHLLGGFATLTLISLLVQRAAGWHWMLPAETVVRLGKLQKLALITLIVVIGQIALGGWTSSNYAALACPDFPLCQNQLVPKADYAHGFNIFQHVGPNYLGGLLEDKGRIAIHFSHRLGALLVTLLVATLALGLFRAGTRETRRWGSILAFALALQISLGISNIVFSLPLAVAVLHNAGGALLLMVLVAVNHRIRTVRTL